MESYVFSVFNNGKVYAEYLISHLQHYTEILFFVSLFGYCLFQQHGSVYRSSDVVFS